MNNEMKRNQNTTDEVVGDPPVYRTQQWLNDTYGGRTGYNRITPDGKTGWTTIYALTRALQIELGITATADNFGPTSERLFNEQFPQGISSNTLGVSHNIYGIIEGALWCKGYSANNSYDITRQFSYTTGFSIQLLKGQAGIDSSSAVVTLKIMKALLSMDQFVLLGDYGGTLEIQRIQQYLNGNYGEYVGLIPCDGLYARDMNRALIKVLQAIEGMSPSEATGNFGDLTRANLPILSNANHPAEAVRLFNFCLTCNGYSSSGTSWNESVVAQTRKFQAKYLIPVTGSGDVNTWMALLVSKGNPDRDALGCDCATVLDSAKAKALYNGGYRYVGRYLSGTVGSANVSKAMTKEEANAVFDAGLRIFAIYQEGSVFLDRYTPSYGTADAEKAIAAAIALGVPHREYIYFAVDYDVMDGEVTSHVIPYFRAISQVFANYGNIYRIGIYGARNVCSRVAAAGLSSSSFVSDMSTGFSGNMGYPIPSDWAFDQFHEYTFSRDGVSFPLDKDAYSGQYSGFNTLTTTTSGKDFTDAEKKAVAKSMLNAFPLPDYEKVDIEWSKTVSIPFGQIVFKYTAKNATLFDLESDGAQYGTLKISNGKITNFDDVSLSSTQEIIDGLDATAKATLGLNGQDLEFAIELAKAVENGKMHIGIKTNSDNELIVYYVAEAYLEGEEIKNTVSLKVEMILKNSNIKVDQNAAVDWSAIMQATLVVSVVIVAAIGVIVVSGTGIIATITAAIVSVLSAIVAFFSGIFGFLV